MRNPVSVWLAKRIDGQYSRAPGGQRVRRPSASRVGPLLVVGVVAPYWVLGLSFVFTGRLMVILILIISRVWEC